MWTIFGQDEATEQLSGPAGKSHAYAVAGPDGIGKQLLAKDLFRARVCTNGEWRGGCAKCDQCQRVDRGVHADLQVLTMEENNSSSGIERIKNSLQRLRLTGVEGESVGVVIDDADRMTTDAANSLLKTLEEPPPGALLILLSPRMERVLPTVRSRCQAINLPPVPTDKLTQYLIEQGAEEDEARRSAIRAQGRPGAALKELSKRGESRAIAPSWFEETYTSSVQGRLSRAGELDQTFRGNREGVISMLEEWREWWRDRLVDAAGLNQYATGPRTTTQMTASAAIQGAEATAEAIEFLRINGNVRLGLERLVLRIPKATTGRQAA